MNMGLSQEHKFQLGLEYSPHFSRLTNEVVEESLKFSHHLFLKVEYPVNPNLTITSGLGYLNTGERELGNLTGTEELKAVRIVHHHNYIAIPVGIKYFAGKYFIQPEIAAAININNRRKIVIVENDGDRRVERMDEVYYTGKINSLSVPVFLTLGKEFHMNKMRVMTGIKGYYSLNEVISGAPRNGHYYGFGLVLGIRMV
jgi:hypothetical protein